MARVLQYICGGLVIGILSILVHIHPAAAGNCAATADCQNGGSCPDTTAPCKCIKGFSGDTCTTAPICTDGGSQCGDHGSCDTSAATYKCACQDDYTGTKCDTAPICTDGGTECGDHGSCDTSAATHTCTCKDSYTGTKCDTAPKSSSPAVRLSLMSLVVSSIVCFIVQ